MNLEQLQQSWNKLSERLEREEVIRKQELRLVMENKVTSYRNRIRLNQILGWVVLLCTVGILFVQGIQSEPFGWIVIGTVVVMDVLLFAPMYSIIMRLAKFNSNIIEQEQMIIRFEKMFVRNIIVIAIFLAALFAYVIIDAVIRHAVPSAEWWLWMILTIIASAILRGWRYMQERERNADIKHRITLLNQFEE